MVRGAPGQGEGASGRRPNLPGHRRPSGPWLVAIALLISCSYRVALLFQPQGAAAPAAVVHGSQQRRQLSDAVQERLEAMQQVAQATATVAAAAQGFLPPRPPEPPPSPSPLPPPRAVSTTLPPASPPPAPSPPPPTPSPSPEPSLPMAPPAQAVPPPVMPLSPPPPPQLPPASTGPVLPSPQPSPLPTSAAVLPPPQPRQPPAPRPPAPPYSWVPLSADQRRRADELVTVFENSSQEPQYNFAADLGDGRGITFGRAGFTTGTGDGLWVVNRYVQAKPVNNTLAPFVPALARILAERTGNASALSEDALLELAANVTAHEVTGALDWGAEDYGVPINDTSGLNGFIEAVGALGGDPIFRQVQDSAMDLLYYFPSQRASAALGLRLPLSKAQLYDTWVQHGSADPRSTVFARSANGIISYVDSKLGGYPLQGVNETLWLETFLQRRRYVLSVVDDVWAASTPRVDLYKWLVEAGAQQLDRPLRLLWERCTALDPQLGYHPGGPCTNQTPGVVSVGGVDYGDFAIP